MPSDHACPQDLSGCPRRRPATKPLRWPGALENPSLPALVRKAKRSVGPVAGMLHALFLLIFILVAAALAPGSQGRRVAASTHASDVRFGVGSIPDISRPLTASAARQSPRLAAIRLACAVGLVASSARGTLFPSSFVRLPVHSAMRTIRYPTGRDDVPQRDRELQRPGSSSNTRNCRPPCRLPLRRSGSPSVR